MTCEELKDTLFHLDFTAGINITHFKRLSMIFGWCDRAIRVVVAALALWGLILASMSYTEEVGRWGFGVAVASMIVAAILNVLPLRDYELQTWDFHRQWIDLQKNVRALELRAFGRFLDVEFNLATKGQFTDPVPAEIEAAVTQVHEQERALQKDDCWEYRWLGELAEGDEYQRWYGGTVRTGEQAKAKLNELRAALAGGQPLRSVVTP